MTAQESNIVNAFETTLAAQLASGGTSMNLADDPGVDSPSYFVIDPDNDSNREVVLWSSGTDHSAATVTRDLDSKHGTDPTHASGTKVRLAVVKQHFEDIHDRVNDIALTGDVTGTLASATQDVATTIAAGAVDFAMINQGDLITQGETITSNDSDTKIPTTAAVKNYVDAETATLTNKTLGAVTLSGAVTGADQEISAVSLKDYAETDVAVTSGTTLAINLANGNTGSVTLAHSVTDIDFTNVPTNGTSSFTLKATQDGTGSRTMAINAITVNGGGNVTGLTAGAAGLTLSTGANDVDLVTFLFFDAGTPLINALLDFS
tara:strand:- start:478 stop:1437 length:960 start_codon:yes stop_codon:yes gene_type:complete